MILIELARMLPLAFDAPDRNYFSKFDANTMKRTFAYLLGVCVLGLVSAVGCGGNSATAEVDVTLTYKGQPVSDTVVTFTSSNNRPAIGRTDAEGRVTGVTTFKPNDGVLPGEYVLTLSRPTLVPEAIQDGSAYAAPSAKNLGFPAKYMAVPMSDLKLTVEKDAPNEYAFELTD